MTLQSEEKQPCENQGMPRREFIQKSLMASGGLFVGMSLGNRLAVPDIQRNKMPRQSGSTQRQRGNNGVGNGEDPQPPGNPPINDGPGTGPGNPGNQGGANNDNKNKNKNK